jgi:glycosyltransferase involved in cell wall biosynthesis
MVLGYPTFLDDYGPLLTASDMVCLTHWESTQMPEGWLENLNHPNMKAIIVGAQWVKEMMETAGVKPPVHVVSLGISDVYQYYRRPARRVYRFLCFGDRYTRKAWDVTARAFAMAFAGRDDVELIIKVRENERGPGLVYPLGDGLMTWNGENFTYKGQAITNVHILDKDMDEYELYDLYKSVDCMVFPSRGEGFGIPPREFAATGGLSIVNKWWADDVMQWAYPVKYTMAPAWQGHRQFEGLGEWAEPDVDHLAQQMAYVEHMERSNVVYARYIGKNAAKRVRRLYNWDRFAQQCWDIWQTEIMNDSSVHTKSGDHCL